MCLCFAIEITVYIYFPLLFFPSLLFCKHISILRWLPDHLALSPDVLEQLGRPFQNLPSVVGLLSHFSETCFSNPRVSFTSRAGPAEDSKQVKYLLGFD